MSLSRRSFLRRTALAGAAAGLGAADLAAGDGGATTARRNRAALRARLPFDGAHQAGIVTPPGDHATLLALDAIAPNRRS